MDIFYASMISLLFVVVSFALHLAFYKSNAAVKGKLPPGKKGWLVIGETLEFLAAARNGHPERFIFDRMARFSSQVFRTSLILEDVVVFCGSAGNKFLFSNEDKLVRAWRVSSLDKIFQINQIPKTEYIKLKKALSNFLLPEALHRYVPVMDLVTQKHFKNEWEDKNEIVVTCELTSNLTLWLACKVFLSIDEPERVKHLSVPFKSVARGMFSLPIDLPGTLFRGGINAAKFIRKELAAVIKQRKTDLINAKGAPIQDLLSQLLLVTDEDGNKWTESNIANKIMGMVVASHENMSSVCAFVVKYLAEFPEVYQGVYTEQMEIANSKELGELLNWNDISKMKYSWNVVCEVLRLVPPTQASFREAVTDFVYNGYSIPKGWKLYWSAVSTHKNPEYFADPEKFDPSRFDGKAPAPYTFIPFGGGHHICPGKEYARLQILMFMHHLVRKFKWEKVVPEEKIIANPFPLPAMGLPIRLCPHQT
ncbi:beta-amyrin 28-monooxygenase-like [Bidens hawaiensis]|uniref:beta-amyrin 28-monooxygenase-like n=1 Tax=Bidens hawaiensis TaxID=980011 RepID=UPI004048FB1D